MTLAMPIDAQSIIPDRAPIGSATLDVTGRVRPQRRSTRPEQAARRIAAVITTVSTGNQIRRPLQKATATAHQSVRRTAVNAQPSTQSP